eukprot:jgi/Mesvir1/29665/Mv21506-RA.1
MSGTLGRGLQKTVRDTAPAVPAAGRVIRAEESAADCLSPKADGARPTTPEEIRRFRKSQQMEPGKTVRHYGQANDPVPADARFGIKTVAGVSAKESIHTYPDSPLQQWHQENAERIYASSKREPLGKGYVRGYNLPDGAGIEKPLGVSINARERDRNPESKELLFPVDRPDLDAGEDPEAHARYVKTHGDYAPGEQRSRGYDWPVDPANTVFGAKTSKDPRENVDTILKPGVDASNYSAKIVTQQMENMRLLQSEELGKPKKLLCHPDEDKDRVFGATSRDMEWHVPQLIRGAYSEAEQQPDPDLGKSVRPGFRNESPDPNRVFGVPTIRLDLPGKQNKSIADSQNYGNEPDARMLLYPNHGSALGVVDEDYLKPRSRDEMKDFFASAGIPVEDDLFEYCYSTACEIDKGRYPSKEEPMCCIHAFRYVLRQARGQK